MIMYLEGRMDKSFVEIENQGNLGRVFVWCPGRQKIANVGDGGVLVVCSSGVGCCDGGGRGFLENGGTVIVRMDMRGRRVEGRGDVVDGVMTSSSSSSSSSRRCSRNSRRASRHNT